MRIFIGKLLVFVLLISLFCFPSNQHAAENITNGQIVSTSSVTPAEQLPVNPPSKDSWDLPQLELLEFLFGSFLLFLGLTTIVLSLFRWKANDLSLIFFGIFCFLYGARTSALKFLFDLPLPFWTYTHWFITYLVPIPAWLFVEQFLGKGWKSSIRRLLQIQIVFSSFAIAVSGYLNDPAAAMVANNIMAVIGILVILANLFQPNLRWNRELKVLRLGFFIFAAMGLLDNIAPLVQKGHQGSFLEGFGFLIFIGCLIYAVAHRFFQNEKGTVLGQFEDIQFKNIHIPLQSDDRIILYTDGIVETSNTARALFGFDRFKEFIVSQAKLPADQFVDALIRQLFDWSGKPSEEALDDDLTLIVADYKHA
jgi:hypothetical protein